MIIPPSTTLTLTVVRCLSHRLVFRDAIKLILAIPEYDDEADFDANEYGDLQNLEGMLARTLVVFPILT